MARKSLSGRDLLRLLGLTWPPKVSALSTNPGTGSEKVPDTSISTLAIGRHFQRPEHFGAEISARLCPCGLWEYRIRAGSSAPIAIRRLESSGSASHPDLRVFSGRRGPGLRWAGATPQEMAAVSGTVSHAEGRNGQSRVGVSPDYSRHLSEVSELIATPSVRLMLN